MKKIIKLFLIINYLFLTSFNAQELTGIATYTSILKNDVELDSTKINDPQYLKMIEMLSKPFIDEFELKFTKTESAYSILPKLNKPDPAKKKGMSISITLMPEGEILYKNFSNGIFVNDKEIYGKQFLIQDSLKNNKWILEKESKMIGDYTCFKATYIKEVEPFHGEEDLSKTDRDKNIVSAWYTPQVPIKNGPSEYDGLPGLILEVQDGVVRYLCTKIVINPIEPIEIKKPNKGKKVSSSEFEEIMKNKNNEMMESFKNKRESRN